MPVYLYICDKCGCSVEENLPIQDRDKYIDSICRCNLDCNGKMFRPPAKSNFHLKGGGWAKDGYATYYGDTPEFKQNNNIR